MKAVILERRGTEAAVLAENGTFMKVPCSGEIGEEIDIARNITSVTRFRQRLVKGLAAAALVLVFAGGAYHYTVVSVNAYVSIDADGNSVELTVNRLGRVISAGYISGGDSELIETINSDIRGMNIGDAVATTLDKLSANGMITEDSDTVIVGITSCSENSAESLEAAIVQKVEPSVHTVMVSEEERREAHRQEIGGGMYVYDKERHEKNDTAGSTSVTDSDGRKEDYTSANDTADDTDDNVMTDKAASDTVREPEVPADGDDRKTQKNHDTPPADVKQTPPPNPETTDAADDRTQSPQEHTQDGRPSADVSASPPDDQSGEPTPFPRPDGQDMNSEPSGEQHGPDDNGTAPRDNNEAVSSDAPPQERPREGLSGPSEQIPPQDMPAPMDGQTNMMPPDRQ